MMINYKEYLEKYLFYIIYHSPLLGLCPPEKTYYGAFNTALVLDWHSNYLKVGN